MFDKLNKVVDIVKVHCAWASWKTIGDPDDITSLSPQLEGVPKGAFGEANTG